METGPTCVAVQAGDAARLLDHLGVDRAHRHPEFGNGWPLEDDAGGHVSWLRGLVSGMLDQQIVECVRQGWRAELGAPAAFRGPGRHVHLRPGHDAAPARSVGVVALGDSSCVSLPPTASAWLQVLQRRDLDADLTDPATVARVIGPVEGCLGPATLAFLAPTVVVIRDNRGSPRCPPATSHCSTWPRPAAHKTPRRAASWPWTPRWPCG
jgi:hypothetical protein